MDARHEHRPRGFQKATLSPRRRNVYFFFFSKLISRGGNYAPMIYRVTDDRYAHNYDYPFNSIVENIMQY